MFVIIIVKDRIKCYFFRRFRQKLFPVFLLQFSTDFAEIFSLSFFNSKINFTFFTFLGLYVRSNIKYHRKKCQQNRLRSGEEKLETCARERECAYACEFHLLAPLLELEKQ